MSEEFENVKQAAVAEILDRRRALEAQIAGVDVELAMAVGDLGAARAALKRMNCHTEARKAARFAQSNDMGAH